MSARSGPGPADDVTLSLFDHAMLLHRQDPDGPLPQDGEPYPDDAAHRARWPRVRAPRDRSTLGQAAARILDEHFAGPPAPPEALARAFHDVYVPSHRHEDVVRAARQADPDRARSAARWLTRHGTDRHAVTVGLALLGEVGTAEDVPLVRTVGLLSDRFGSLAATTLERLPDPVESLVWLAARVKGWGRLYVVEAICRLDDPAARAWLLRHAIDGDFLNGYCAGRVARATGLHEALPLLAHDPEVVDHAGRLLHVLTGCEGMGTDLRTYPHAARVLQAHARAVGRLRPTVERVFTAGMLARHLASVPPEKCGLTAAERTELAAAYRRILDRQDWVDTARAALAADDARVRFLQAQPQTRLRLRAFPGEPDGPAPAEGCPGPPGSS